MRLYFILIAVFTLLFGYWVYQLDKDDFPEATDLVDPEMGPPEAFQGFQILQQTSRYASQYVGDKVSCNNCHFNGGNTLGGRNNGIPLVGVSHKYPLFSKREGKTIDLAERIGGCFMRSMNGKAPPADSPEMRQMIAYFDWISSPVPPDHPMPWLGLKFLTIKYAGDRERGEKVYSDHCALCHGKNGEGSFDEEGNAIPPLWGSESFNDGAGMNRPEMFAAFTYWNMPFGQPFLTEEQAIDVAAFVTRQPRPKWTK